MSIDTEVISSDARLRGHVYYDATGNPSGPAWYFTVDWLRPDGTRDTDIDSYEYGCIFESESSNPRREALRIVHEVIAEFNDKHRDLAYGSQRP
ncbi:hypothetical protein ACT17_22575 [Mycolicibacterium conceptionense]|uniref:Uncharacterized protein n=1 Tax=Mycolicibacterium conceptionense TaxID=451644 RepID=A0A0J8U2W4_9MYCO|nr:hypothetical protein [Mycolicibacterium conceptionense]KMV15898.1 hypothetical protein ACT17_22575 [Mycolicibacterium conceptionense]